MQATCLQEKPLGAIFSMVSRAQFVFLNNRLLPLGLSAGQFPVLMLLAHGENLMQEDLVRHYRLDKGTIARAVKKLEDAGYIRRTIDPANRRAVRLFLTEKGAMVIPTLRQINRDWETCMCRGLSAAESVALRRLMERVAVNSHLILEKDGDGEP